MRTVAFVARYCQKLRRKVKEEPLTVGPLTQHELARSEMTIFRLMQHEEYPDEVAVLLEERDQKTLVRLEPGIVTIRKRRRRDRIGF